MSDKKEILIATENKGKAHEIREIFKDADYVLRFLYEFKDETGDLNIQENAKTFEGNAIIKAIVVGEKIGMLTLADDSGLCVDALDGAPGIYSARYSSEKTDAANNAKLLDVMKGVPKEKRGCHYHCTVAIYDPLTNFVETTEGTLDGRLAFEPRGNNSFGYAPITEVGDFEKTYAEFDCNALVEVNHRGKAFRAAIKALDAYIGMKN